MSFARRHKKKLIALGVLVAAPVVAHLVVDRITHLDPPDVARVDIALSETDGVRHAGKGWSAVRGVRLAHLAGTPEEIGTEHSTLLRDRMIVNEQIVWDGFRDVVPFAPARVLLFDAGRYRYRHVEAGFPEARRREVAAEARAFTPDPFAGYMATYTRMVFLHSLYDIALSFEHSPLLGCTAFGLGPEATADGHALFARAFDFEAADVFDRDKAVFIVREDGKIPFASVAWPGLVGVVTGMNAEGVAVAVNGGRAREPSTTGIPVAFSLRETLDQAHDTNEAVAILSKQEVMVSHLVFVGDAKGHFVVVERAPGMPAFVRESKDPSRIAVTNHFEGPLAGDPRDERVRETSTTLPRRARADELVSSVAPKSATVTRAVAMLRDHGCASGETCPLGDRRSIDAFIATHGVVFDLTAKTAWVSEGPHLSGRFVKIDLAAIVSTKEGMVPTAELEEVAADDALADGRYAEGRKRAGRTSHGSRRSPAEPSHPRWLSQPCELEMTRRPITIASALSATLAALAMVAVSPSSHAEPTDGGAPPPAAPEAREKLEGAKLDAVLADIARARKAVRTLRANFTQERKLTLLATSVKSTGELAYVAPERLRWELAPPDDIVYLIGPEGLSYRTRSSHATVPATGATIAKALADLRALLGGDLSLLKDRYTLGGSRSGNGSDVEITGAAKDASASVRGFTLTLDKSLVLPVKARLIEGKSDAIEIIFSNAQINVPIDPATMKP